MQKSFITSNARPKKKYGQNFLRDESIVDKIIEEASITEEDCILEIGPGRGALTGRLLEKAGKVVAVEIDDELIPFLQGLYGDNGRFKLIRGDILSQDLENILPLQKNIKVVANLPYYITTPILMKLLESDIVFDKIILMVQWEVGQRIVAKEATPEYGALSVAVNFYSQPHMVTKVSADCFYPVPKVDSSVVCLDYKAQPLSGESKQWFFKCVKAAFSQRRKTLANALVSNNIGSKEQIQKAIEGLGWDQRIRGEALGLSDFIKLSEKL